MHKFFAQPQNIGESTIHLDGDDAKHITKVLRLGQNDMVMVCDGNCNDYLCTIATADKNGVALTINQVLKNTTECPLDITIYQSIPKSDKMDYIIQKCVELGVNEIIPVVTERTVVKVKDGDRKRERWQRIALEAAKQCGRGVVPAIGEVCTFREAIDSEGGLKLFPYENERASSIRKVLEEAQGVQKVRIFVGPEGGFAEEEAECARENGWQTVKMGPRILRCETAPVAATAAVIYMLGDW